MSILTANLKFFYQRPALWVGYAFISIFSFPLFIPPFSHKPGQPSFLFHALAVSLVSGFICTSLWKETLGKPFSFCLPKSRHVPGKVILIAGTVINLLISLLYLYGYLYGRQPETFFFALQIFISAFFSGMSLFLISALLVFQATPNNQGALIFLIIPLLAFPSVTREIEAVLISHPLSLMLLGMGLGLFTWFRMGQRDLRRRLCLLPSLSLFDSWNQTKQKKFRNLALARKSWPQDERRREQWENFFLARMKYYDVLSVGRNVWGNLYRFLGYPGHRPGQIILLIVGIVIFSAFCLHMPNPTHWIFFTIPIALAGTSFPLPLRHFLLLPAGRKEQLGTAIVLMPVYTILVIAAFTGVGVFWQGLYTLVPQITISGRTYTCDPFEWTFLYTPLFFLPACFILRRLFVKHTIFIRMILMTVIIPMGCLLFPWLTQKNPVILLTLIAVSWALCFMAYRDYFQRTNLAGQGKG
jgi:hypothetical protein